MLVRWATAITPRPLDGTPIRPFLVKMPLLAVAEAAEAGTVVDVFRYQ